MSTCRPTDEDVNCGNNEGEEFNTGPLSVLTTSVKNNTQCSKETIGQFAVGNTKPVIWDGPIGLNLLRTCGIVHFGPTFFSFRNFQRALVLICFWAMELLVLTWEICE
ncbi:hypothetical protein Pint_00968 [Pistacia integerrima]|uniref:Uncharacterized protein n=1 Tax=Pistacia integerrima TaxID=434235 RepID=A0ACC0ZJP8_9ROSI|nr:hypothetical protein Pint_00968 [Pistacia integerrima]